MWCDALAFFFAVGSLVLLWGMTTDIRIPGLHIRARLSLFLFYYFLFLCLWGLESGSKIWS